MKTHLAIAILLGLGACADLRETVGLEDPTPDPVPAPVEPVAEGAAASAAPMTSVTEVETGGGASMISAVFGASRYTVDSEGLGDCRALTPSDALLDLNSLTALERPVAPLTWCERPGGAFGAVKVLDGTLQFERSDAGFAIGDQGAFLESMRGLRGASEITGVVQRVEAQAGPALLTELRIDDAPCIGFDLYGPETTPGRTDRLAYGALCESIVDPTLSIEALKRASPGSNGWDTTPDKDRSA